MTRKHFKFRRSWAKIIVRLTVGLLLFFVVLVLFVRSPWGQHIIVDKVVDYVSDKTGTEVSIDKLFITFSGNVFLEGLYLADQENDTLLYSKKLEASVALVPLIRGNTINIKSLQWSGVIAHITRDSANAKYNFDFLADAFSNPSDTVTSVKPKIHIGAFNFKDFKIDYNDGLNGIKGDLKLGTLDLEMEEVDVVGMRFTIHSMKIANSDITYKQWKSFESAENEQSSTNLPFFKVDELHLEQVKLNYESLPDSVVGNINLGHLIMELPKLDLTRNLMFVNRFNLNDSEIILKQFSNTKAQADSTNSSNEFKWPNWDIEAKEIVLHNNHIVYQRSTIPSINRIFDPGNINVTALNLDTNGFYLKNKTAGFTITAMSFEEQSGFNLKNLALDLKTSDTEFVLSDLQLTANESSLSGNLALQYASLNRFLDRPELAKVEANFPLIQLDINNAFIFGPELKNNKYLVALSQQKIQQNGVKLNGTLNALKISNLNLKWGLQTSMAISGTVYDILDADKLQVEIKQLAVQTKKADVLKFVDEEQIGISIPQIISLNGNLKGGLSNIAADLKLKIPEGNIDISGTLANRSQFLFDTKVSVDSLDLGQLLKNQELGRVSFQMESSGAGLSMNTLNANIKSNFGQLGYYGYDFSGLLLDGYIENGTGHVNLNFKDENLDLTLQNEVELDTIASKIKTLLDVKGADLYALGMTQEKIKTKFKLNVDFKGNARTFDIHSTLYDGIAVFDKKQYDFGTFELDANASNEKTSIHIESEILKSDLISNTGPTGLFTALKRHFESYLEDATLSDTITDPVKLKLDFVVHQAPILNEVFLQGLDQLDSISGAISFDEKAHQLTADFMAPMILYGNSKMDSLQLNINANQNDLKFDLGWAALESDSIRLGRTYLKGIIANKALELDFIALDKEEKLLHIQSELRKTNDTIHYRIKPSELILNRQQWSIPENNEMLIAKNFIGVKNFEFTNGLQKVTLSSSLPTISNEHLGLVFENFQMESIASLLNSENILATGQVKGEFVLEYPFGDSGILADLSVSDFNVMEIPFGELSLQANSKDIKQYDFNLSLKGVNADLDLTGDYQAAQSGAKLNLDLALNDFQVSVLEKFSNEYISAAKGGISGTAKVSGTIENPVYAGHFNFNDASAVVNTLNANFTLPEEQIRIDNAGIYLNNFMVTDAVANIFSLNGNILTADITNPSFDLALKANNFSLLNSSKKDNELFFGKVKMSADLSIKGNLMVPKIRGNLSINEGSDFTFIVPESQLDIIERDGVVLFVNRESPDDIMTRQNQNESSSRILKGYDIGATLKVDKNSSFTIVIDEKTGDNFKVAGIGDFDLRLEPNGRTNLAGKYEITDGHYQASLYNLVKRKFQITPGGTITWSGDPFDAVLDVRAIYEVETSASGLMAAKTTGQSTATINKYRQGLPFFVYINVDGKLLNPEISFNLDMPEDKRGALGGEVYTEVQQLNTQQDELNKQVFSLLVLNRFFPGSSSDGSNGGAASIARDNVNKVLSGQLNNFSNKLLGKSGLELDFGLNSFTDYQGATPQERTLLDVSASKQMFNNRLIVQVGSEVDVAGSNQDSQSTPLIGNVSLEYLLTEDGRFRIQGFSKNEYEGVIDGQVLVTGIALIFTREFNKFKDLWEKAILDESTIIDK